MDLDGIMEDAISNKDNKTITLLLNNVIGIDKEKNPLISAVSTKNVFFLKVVLNYLNKMGDLSKIYIATVLTIAKCPLFYMVYLDQVELLKIMLERGISANENCEDRGIPPIFHWLINHCCTSDKLQMIKIFLKHGVDIHGKDFEGNIALHNVSTSYSYEIARLLIAAGAEVNTLNNNWVTPLHNAIFNGNYELMQCLLEHGGLLKPNRRCRRADIHLSLQRSLIHAIDHLIECEIEINGIDVFGNTILHLTMKRKNFEFAKALLQRGANINTENHDKYLPLHFAFEYRGFMYMINDPKGVDLLELYFPYDMDINKKNPRGLSILRLVIELLAKAKYTTIKVDLLKPVLKHIAKLELKGSTINETDVNLIQNDHILR